MLSAMSRLKIECVAPESKKARQRALPLDPIKVTSCSRTLTALSCLGIPGTFNRCFTPRRSRRLGAQSKGDGQSSRGTLKAALFALFTT